jgi:Icc-related predicted phosphoesterase
MPNPRELVRIAALADLHYGRNTPAGSLAPLFSQVTDAADVLVLAGDLTDYGLPDEARGLAREITSALKIPAVGVLGNHDVESNQQEEVRQILGDAGLVMLDGGTCEVHGIGFAGVKGFAGGFGRRALGPWGEQTIKQFVHEAVNEALKLEAALARLRTDSIVAVMHYSPVQATVEGEPLEIYPFLGSSRLEEPLNRYSVTAVFHGHAHHGRPEGRTTKNVRVYNVSMSLMRELSPSQPFRVIEVSMMPLEPDTVVTGGTSEADRRQRDRRATERNH